MCGKRTTRPSLFRRMTDLPLPPRSQAPDRSELHCGVGEQISHRPTLARHPNPKTGSQKQQMVSNIEQDHHHRNSTNPAAVVGVASIDRDGKIVCPGFKQNGPQWRRYSSSP